MEDILNGLEVLYPEMPRRPMMKGIQPELTDQKATKSTTRTTESQEEVGDEGQTVWCTQSALAHWFAGLRCLG